LQQQFEILGCDSGGVSVWYDRQDCRRCRGNIGFCETDVAQRSRRVESLPELLQTIDGAVGIESRRETTLDLRR
jgi:hypothetical protein